jgi:antitoxin HicB
MRSFGFPARVAKGKDGYHTVTFRDVPEAMTDDRQLSSAMLAAADALTAALAGHVKEGRDLPKPSKPRLGETLVFADPSFSAKVVLRQVMAERKISNVGLAKLLKKDEKEIRRMIDPDQPTKLDRLDKALQALGYRVIVGVQLVAPSRQAGREAKDRRSANVIM